VGRGNNHNSRIWRLHSGYDNWTDNCDIRDVLWNWYRCGSFLGTLSQRRLQRVESRFKSKTEVQSGLLADETKTAIKDKIDGIDKLTEEDFDALIIMTKRLRRTLLEESKNMYKCSRCGNVYYSKPKFCSNCGLAPT
jgi:rubrerythrin